jgi:hypothetical protein
VEVKDKRLKRTLTAAPLTLVATVAYSQTDALTTKIPFAFRAVGSDLPAGYYNVSPVRATSGDSRTMELRKLDTGEAVFLPPRLPPRTRKMYAPRLVFKCVEEEGCSLASLWSGTGSGLISPLLRSLLHRGKRRETIYLDRFKDNLNVRHAAGVGWSRRHMHKCGRSGGCFQPMGNSHPQSPLQPIEPKRPRLAYRLLVTRV